MSVPEELLKLELWFLFLLLFEKEREEVSVSLVEGKLDFPVRILFNLNSARRLKTRWFNDALLFFDGDE